jgi:hypothetical protein
MHLPRKGVALAAAAIVAAALGTADAQTGAPAAADLTTQRDVNLTPEQQLAQARGFGPAMEQGRRRVAADLEQARTKRDVVKVLCLNDKLSQIDVAIRSAEDRLTQLQAAVDQKSVDRARHEFQIMKVLRDRVRELEAEAKQCIGEEVGFVGDSRVTVDIDPNIPETDPSEFPIDPITSSPPVVSSPNQ